MEQVILILKTLQARICIQAFKSRFRLVSDLWASRAPVQVRRARPVIGSITMITGKSTRR